MGYKKMYEEAQKTGAVKDLKPEFFKFEKEGDSIIGRLKSIVHLDSSLTAEGYNHYIFETDEGMIKFPLSGYNDKEIGTQLRKNHVYYIEYKGTVKLEQGRKLKDFHVVEVKDSGALETSEEDVPF